MRAESAVDIMAAKQEQVMTVTKKYWKGPVILSCAVKPEKGRGLLINQGPSGIVRTFR